MKILVTTPTGQIGRRIVQELLAPEFSVRVIVRDPVRLPEDVRGQVEIVRGSTDDPAILRKALDGVQALFWCVPPASVQETNVRADYERFARAACQAIRDARTSRVVTISAVGKELARNAGPISALHAMEDILSESGAAIRHLRCGAFMENFFLHLRPICEQGVFSLPMPGHIPVPMVAVSDVADVALRWLVRRDWTGVRSVAARGPEDISFNQAATVLERVLERPVQYKEVSANHYVQALTANGASVEFARSLVEMYAELAAGIARVEPETVQSSTPTTLAAWAEGELLPEVRALTPGTAYACTCQI